MTMSCGEAFVEVLTKANGGPVKPNEESELPTEEVPSVECFFCSGHLPCREHKPRDFADVDFQEYVMGEIDGKELFERQGVEYSG